MRLALLTGLLLLASCSTAVPAPTAPAPPSLESVTLRMGSSATSAGHELVFDKVLEDSRCPKGVTCVWEGNAKIVVLLDGAPLELNTSSRFATKQTHAAVTVELKQLEPTPVAGTQTTGYVATLLVGASK